MQKFFNKLNNFHIAAILFFIIALVHIDILLAPVEYYFSSFDLKDLNYYINIRQYAAHILLSGHIPLWTLKIFSGHPFLANSETAIFYPLNSIFLLLPISKAINFSFLIHFFILSFSVFLWINNKIKDKTVSLCAAIISIFSASYYLHSCAGHLSNIITMSWFASLLFLYDKVFESKSYKFIIPISIIISLQIFAGHFQYVYYTALASLLYILFFCFNKVTLITIFCSYFVALFLSAIQLLPSIEFYLQGARITGILQHVSIKSALLSLITLIFPFYTQLINQFFWETAIYIGLFNIFIILLAVFNNSRKEYLKYILLISILYLLSYKQVSNALGTIIPLFNSFRSPVKLNFFISILLLPVLSYGLLQVLSKDIKINKYFVFSIFVFSITLIVFHNVIADFIQYLLIKNVPVYNNFMTSILFTGLLILLFSICLIFRRYVVFRIIILIVAVIQPIFFVRNFTKPFLFDNDYDYEQIEIFYVNNDIRYFANERYSLEYNYENVFGATSDVLKNYLDFIKHLERPIDLTNIFGILRCQYVIDDKTGNIQKYNMKFLKRANVFYDYLVEQDKNTIFSILSNKQFDYTNTVILEKEPKYKINKKGISKINILSLSGNTFDLKCNTSEPAVILISSNYEKGWKAYDLDDNNIEYEIIPADYIYRAISVDSGTHKIRFEYKPFSFVIGMWISIVSWLLLLIMLIYYKKTVFMNKNKPARL